MDRELGSGLNRGSGFGGGWLSGFEIDLMERVPSFMFARNDLDLIVDVRVSWDLLVTEVAPDVCAMSISKFCWALNIHLVSWSHLWKCKVEAPYLFKMRNLELNRLISSQLLPSILNQLSILQLSSPMDPSILPWLTLVPLGSLHLGDHGDLGKVHLYLIRVVHFIVMVVLKDHFHVLLIFGQSCLCLLLFNQ